MYLSYLHESYVSVHSYISALQIFTGVYLYSFINLPAFKKLRKQEKNNSKNYEKSTEGTSIVAMK